MDEIRSSRETAAVREKSQTRRRKSLSDKQLAILEVIQRSIAAHGYPPSMREIGDAVGLKSLSSVTHQLNQLELSGYLRRDPGKTRAMEVLIDLPGTAAENPADIAPAVGDAAMVPLVGRIAAGVPITADQQVEEIFPLPRQLVGKGDLFMLKVSGESMIDAAICDGDWVVVRSQPTAENGDIVAAMLDDEATVKTFRQRDGHTWLLPATPPSNRSSATTPSCSARSSPCCARCSAPLSRARRRPFVLPSDAHGGTHALGGADHVPQRRDRLVIAARLQPAVGIDPDVPQRQGRSRPRQQIGHVVGRRHAR